MNFGRNVPEWRIREQERMDALPLRSACAFCPWEYTGTAVEARQQALQHRLDAHPERAYRKRRRNKGRNLGSFVQPKLRSDEEEEIRVEHRKRARLLGIEL